MGTPFNELLAFLMQLNERKIHFALDYIRPEAILVQVAVPGERWEVEFMQDGTLEVERFGSTGTLGGRELLDDLFARFSD